MFRLPRSVPLRRSILAPPTRPIITARPPLSSPSRDLHVRAISFSTIPRMVARAFRVPLYGAAVGAGGVGYASYKLEGECQRAPVGCVRGSTDPWQGVRNATGDLINNVGSALGSAYESANQTLSNGATLAGDLSDALGRRFRGAAGDVADSVDGFGRGTQEWWEAFTSQFGGSKSQAPPNPSAGPKNDWRPGEGPGEPSSSSSGGSGGGGGGPAVAALTAATLASDDQTSNGDEKEEHQLLQLTKKLIEIRSVLLSVDQSDALKLPSIVVIGSQSSGKSSVLEAIVGHEFLPK